MPTWYHFLTREVQFTVLEFFPTLKVPVPRIKLPQRKRLDTLGVFSVAA